jgi:HEAT repeat protein
VIGEQKAVPGLLDLAKQSRFTNHRRSAVAGLGRLRAPEAETLFIRYLDDREEAAWAADWLAEIGTEASVGPLRAAAKRDRHNKGDYRAALEAIERRNSDTGT